ncbi:DRC9 protein, partial [Urocolius indicus]|nr:DRC9 protein [Urocolius indicus]
TKKELDVNHQELMPARQGRGKYVTSMSPKSIKHKQQLGKSKDPKSTHRLSNQARKHSALSVEDLSYCCIPFLPGRQYASDIITATLKTTEEYGTFNSLIEAKREKAKKTEVYDLLIRSEEGEKQIKSLEKQLRDVKKETEQELQNQDGTIAYRKDMLQEMKAKANIEISYRKRKPDLQVQQTQKKCRNAEKVLEKEIQNLKSKTDEEIRVHTETENFLERQQKNLEEKLDYWLDKYERDTDAKDQELDALEAARADNLEKLQKLAREVR